MREQKNNRSDPEQRDGLSSRIERQSSTPNDLPDSPADMKKLESEETYIDLPDVKDIPGQEFVNAPPLDALGDTTISSADEEGESVFDQDEEVDPIRTGGDNVTRGERKALEQTDYLPTRDEDNLNRARMDNVDFENEPLNEKGFGEERTGSDLDSSATSGRGSEDDETENTGSMDSDNISGRRP